jgi:hypothetical protein
MTQGTTTDRSKVAVVIQWLTPSNVKELRDFLGLVGYYRRFIKNYGVISRPLSQLLKKEFSSCGLTLCSRHLRQLSNL